METGLYYYKSRYYNPLLGRFTQPDTVVPDAKNLQAFNRYTYVNNNPLKYVDPTGHFVWMIAIAIMIGAFYGTLAGIVAAAAFGLTGLLAVVVGGIIAGSVGGLISGSITGGVKGALWGMLFGAVLGGAGGVVGYGLGQVIGTAGAIAVLSGIGASVSFASDGWEGLVTFGFGLAGGLAGGLLGAAVVGSKAPDLKYGKDSDFKLNWESGKNISYGSGAKAGPELALGFGGGVGSNANVGVIWGVGGETHSGVLYDVSSKMLGSYKGIDAGLSDFGFGGGAGISGEVFGYSGSPNQFRGAEFLTIDMDFASFSIAQGSQRGYLFMLQMGVGRGLGVWVDKKNFMPSFLQ
jgi:RHS repeat-associated protein